MHAGSGPAGLQIRSPALVVVRHTVIDQLLHVRSAPERAQHCHVAAWGSTAPELLLVFELQPDAALPAPGYSSFAVTATVGLFRKSQK